MNLIALRKGIEITIFQLSVHSEIIFYDYAEHLPGI